jgi:hypothetical protein
MHLTTPQPQDKVASSVSADLISDCGRVINPAKEEMKSFSNPVKRKRTGFFIFLI